LPGTAAPCRTAARRPGTEVSRRQQLEAGEVETGKTTQVTSPVGMRGEVEGDGEVGNAHRTILAGVIRSGGSGRARQSGPLRWLRTTTSVDSEGVGRCRRGAPRACSPGS